MIPRKNVHGQPIYQFPAALIQNYGKAIDQLIGLCRGILIDGIVSDQEATAFRQWVDRFFAEQPTFPFDDIKRRLDRIFADGKVDPEERAELADVMHSLGGLDITAKGELEAYSSALPLCDPAPEIIHAAAEFVVTGRCAYGTRAKVWQAIEALGGVPHDTPRASTKYLLIGQFASRDWVHTSYGRKIERAVELRSAGHPIHIISEAHWHSTITPKV